MRDNKKGKYGNYISMHPADAHGDFLAEAGRLLIENYQETKRGLSREGVFLGKPRIYQSNVTVAGLPLKRVWWKASVLK